MDRFILKKLIVSGGDHVDSIIQFSDGFNLIIGPSNTGKSFIMDAIDYAFGFIPKPDNPSKLLDNNYGYTTITLELQTTKGMVSFSRELGSPRIKVTSAHNEIEDGFYSVNKNTKKNINGILLQLMGIGDEHRILANESGRTQSLTFRSLLHLFFMKQSVIARESSALRHPLKISETSSTAALLYLLTGQDANNITENNDPKMNRAKRDAIILYIRQKRDEIAEKRNVLEAEISKHHNDDIETLIEELNREIAAIQIELNTSNEKSKSIISELYYQNTKLIECEAVLQNFNSLNQQYSSDVRRLEFILNGHTASQKIPHHSQCPFCASKIEVKKDDTLISGASIELKKLAVHIRELAEAIKTAESQKENILATIHSLEEEKSELDNHISATLKNKLHSFQSELEKNMKLVRWKQLLETIEEDELKFNSDLHEKETESDDAPEKHKILELFNPQLIQEYEKELVTAFEVSHIGGSASTRLNMKSFDIEINNKSKPSCMGGGYCSILNVLTALTMQAYIYKQNRNASGFFIIDSPLTQLSESDQIDDNDTIKHHFIKYLISQATNLQVIMIEHKDKIPSILLDENSSSDINIIEFTRNPNHGRYGFLNGVVDPEHQQE